MNSMTEQQAYLAMFRFLEQWYERTKADELGGMLGSMALLPDGSTADPAAWKDWLKAVDHVKQGGDTGQLELR
jgi:hypothetical protein